MILEPLVMDRNGIGVPFEANRVGQFGDGFCNQPYAWKGFAVDCVVSGRKERCFFERDDQAAVAQAQPDGPAIDLLFQLLAEPAKRFLQAWIALARRAAGIAFGSLRIFLGDARTCPGRSRLFRHEDANGADEAARRDGIANRFRHPFAARMVFERCGIHSHEQREHQGHEIGVGDDPAFVILVLFLLAFGSQLAFLVSAKATPAACSSEGSLSEPAKAKGSSIWRKSRGFFPSWMATTPSTIISWVRTAKLVCVRILAAIGRKIRFAIPTP